MNTNLITTLPNLIEMQSNIYRDKILFIDENRQVTYEEFYQDSLKVARGLMEIGVGRGDRVATYLHNSIDLVEAYFGIANCGALNVFLNPALMPREVEIILRDSEAQVLITDYELFLKTMDIYSRLASLKKVIVVGDLSVPEFKNKEICILKYDNLKQYGFLENKIDLSPTDPVWIQYTSGTTGIPKGAELTHQGVAWVAAAMAEVLRLNDSDVYLGALPMFHSYASCVCIVQVISIGATEIIQKAFSPLKTPDVIEKHKITIFPAVPTMFNYILNVGAPMEKFNSLRLCISAGAILTSQLRKQIEDKYNIQIYDGFGTTECCSFVTLNNIDKPRPYGSCGLVLPGMQAMVVDKNLNEVKRGELGEHLNIHRYRMRGYINRPDATAEALRNGWYRTGDICWQDEDGYFYIKGRNKEVIISGAYNIYPREVEDVINTIEGILEVAVVGMPDEGKGEVPKVVIVLKEGFSYSENDIIDFCKQNLAKYKIPKYVQFVESIPKTSSGKIKKFELK
ncbi:MAG: AMP-binding protein [Actinobacteria bacterium]|nr:AMP-binding protein [Actinomycetota bacterium]